jgi:hypothetical protein
MPLATIGIGAAGTPGFGGEGQIGGAGTNGLTFVNPVDLALVAGQNLYITISEGAGNASVTITY